MQTLACPLCAMENIYPDGDNHVCADCGHEWPIAAATDSADATWWCVTSTATCSTAATR